MRRSICVVIATLLLATSLSAQQSAGTWKIYDQVDENGKHVRALVVQGIVVGSKDKTAVMMLHKREDASWTVGFGLSVEAYTSPITIRGDDDEALETIWKVTPDKGGKTAQFPLRDQEEFLQSLQTTSTFEVAYPRHPDMVRTVLRFDVRGLTVALKKLMTTP